ncbi:2-oxo-4-hydroxy-4-carboxy-5-ureidoimidazoline decarboxylase [Acuticoccus mangrovi]|uniref:2-oxo-4-hydroxy-4-carboxy-5-ureidoimidazoline decarboxylase n=1 Tax=Acuticoccus mangrovi TaxID=2796142 RepID=A0A934IF63_9HYPH|nr:2-oxo-4-hydroxy-4-carboxy-5-ureidoimidazoline decarboxylase [Acuticoccus mangrovi]MBJ3775398.1 2-oxo-4-hydroxy-4-carboxy-5-ureidoimidazoline decarboxylase [Acuticoccus mangrovi]
MTPDDARAAFIARYGSIYEHSPWIPEAAWDGGVDPADDLATVFARVVDRAGTKRQLALLRSHPDLASRLGLALTEHSAAEQAGAGLDRCTEAEFAEFQTLNERYVRRFGFPFIIAVKGLDRAAILDAFRRRVEGEPAAEFRAALDEVHKIARLRLASLSAGPEPLREPAEPAALRALVEKALARHGADAPNVAAIADTVLAAERDGSESHGLFRLPAYIRAIDLGVINPTARPRRIDGPEGAVVIDGDGGVAPAAYAIGLPAVAETAERLGTGVLAVKNTRHFAALWHEVEYLAERGLAGFACTANFPYLAPAGGKRPFFGTNPLAFAYPRADAPPVVFDLAASAMARGDIMIAGRDGRQVPPGVGIDANGEPTTDPAEILAGAQLPFGGHKGSAIALMVELLAGGVVGEVFSDEAPLNEAGVPPGGVFVLALSPEKIGGPGTLARADAFLARLAAEPGVRLPGARRHKNRARGGPLMVQSALLATVRLLAGEA